MCVVSNIGDYFGRDLPQRHPWLPKPQEFTPIYTPPINAPTREEFDELKKELKAIKKLLQEAKKVDAATKQPDCEMDTKVAFLKGIAKYLGVDLSEVFPASA